MQPREWCARLLRGGELRPLYPAHPEYDGGHARERELRKVFEHHPRRNLDQVRLPERIAQRGGKALSQLRIVVGRVCGGLNFYPRLARRPARQRFSPPSPPDPCPQGLFHFLLLLARPERKSYPVGD